MMPRCYLYLQSKSVGRPAAGLNLCVGSVNRRESRGRNRTASQYQRSSQYQRAVARADR
jgi:hypothetical protein